MKLNVIGAIVGLGVITLGLGACASNEENVGDTSDNLTAEPTVETHRACGSSVYNCMSHVVDAITSPSGIRMLASHSAPTGLGATDLQQAYNLDVTLGEGATVAIIDAYGYKDAEKDLGVYRKQYGLPACTVASGCLTIVNQEGATSPLPKDPPSDDDWTVETALDLDMASAACPKCKILLIQADDDQGDGLMVSQAIAAKLKANVVSNSWAMSESKTATGLANEKYFRGLAPLGIFAAAGDSGYDNGGQGAAFPSTSDYVTAVGGTNLKKSSTSRGWSETAWSGNASTGAGGSSCSISIPTPSWQKNVATTCKFRAASDVAAVADPATGPAVYNHGQWQQVGGTSAASPFVAAVYALTGHGADGPKFSYNNTAAFNDVTSGKNGTCKGVLCNAAKGWDGPTGNGTPDGKKLTAITN